MTELTRLRTALEHAPANPGPLAPGLRGWTDDKITICAHCAGRIMARGCDIGRMFPVWDEPVQCDLKLVARVAEPE